MKAILVLALALGTLLTVRGDDASPAIPVSGKFYASIDDNLVLWLNGAKVMDAGYGEAVSNEIAIKSGDRLVAQLRNNPGTSRRFKLLFISTDRRTMFPFRAVDFRIMTDSGATDFTSDQLANFSKTASISTDPALKGMQGAPIQSSSQWLWGKDDVCALACVLRPESFLPVPGT